MEYCAVRKNTRMDLKKLLKQKNGFNVIKYEDLKNILTMISENRTRSIMSEKKRSPKLSKEEEFIDMYLTYNEDSLTIAMDLCTNSFILNFFMHTTKFIHTYIIFVFENNQPPDLIKQLCDEFIVSHSKKVLEYVNLVDTSVPNEMFHTGFEEIIYNFQKKHNIFLCGIINNFGNYYQLIFKNQDYVMGEYLVKIPLS